MKAISFVAFLIGILLAIGGIVDLIKNPASSVSITPIFIGSVFFLILGFLNQKNTYKQGGPHVAAACSVLFIFKAFFALSVGKFTPRWSGTVIYLETDPEAFWAIFAFWFALGVACAIYAFWKFKSLNNAQNL